MGNKIEQGKRFASTVISRLSPGGSQDWVSVILVFLTLMVAALSLEQAHWVSRPVFGFNPDISRACQLFDDYLPPQK